VSESNPKELLGPRAYLLLFATVKVLIHLGVGNGYGYFRDEFYYLACSEHLAWGYVDQPPLSILILWSGRHVLGDSVVAIRCLAALAGGATVYLVGWMAGRLGGGRFAQGLAMTAAIVAPLYLGLNGFYSMNAFDLLLWAAAAAVLIRILQGAGERAAGTVDTRLWLLLGLVLGLGLMNKISVLWLGFGLFIGLVLTPARRFLLTRGPWLAGILALVIFLPHILWQVANDWPTLEFIRNATGNKMRSVALLDFFSAQFLSMHPLNAPIWIAGLIYLLVLKGGRRFRSLGWIYLAVMILLLLNRTSRPGYLSPAYTMLFAAGGVAIEGWLARLRRRLVAQAAILSLLALGGSALAPLALPVLDIDDYIGYARSIGVAPSTSERKELRELPQHYADMFGWQELVATLAGIYHTLPDGDRERAAFFVGNYGEAGAIDHLGRRYDLPKATSGHNNYWLWGPRGYSGEVMIIVGGSRDEHLGVFEQVEQAGTTDCHYCMPYEDDQPIFVCRGLKVPLAEIWPRLKHFD
jgi:hypothetical protein